MSRPSRPSRRQLNAVPVVAPDVPDSAHLYTCATCSQQVDARRLGDVLHHEEHGHGPIPPEAPTVLRFIAPMIPTLVDEPPAGEGWIHEIKYDGYRTQLAIDAAGVRAFTRNGHDWTDRYAPLVAAAAKLPCTSAIIDGEVIIQDEQGRSDFDRLRAAIGRTPERLVFMAFDLLHQDGRDLRKLPIEQRRDRLAELLGDAPADQPLHFSQHVIDSGEALFRAVEAMGLEGIVSKRRGSRYSSGGTRAWLKTKCWVEDEFWLVGTEAEPGGPAIGLLARETSEGLVYAGGAALTLGGAERERLWTEADRLTASRPALPMGRRKGVRWVRPELRLRVRYLAGSDKLRHATAVALR